MNFHFAKKIWKMLGKRAGEVSKAECKKGLTFIQIAVKFMGCAYLRQAAMRARELFPFSLLKSCCSQKLSPLQNYFV